MTDEIALAKALGRAAQAQRLLDDELLQEAFAALDRDYTKAWRETAARDTDQRRQRRQAGATRVERLGRAAETVRDYLGDRPPTDLILRSVAEGRASRRMRSPPPISGLPEIGTINARVGMADLRAKRKRASRLVP
jgi:hypothetical protein